MAVRIFLDDERSPKTQDFNFIARSYNEFVGVINHLSQYRIKIDYISFDHDLGIGKDGYDCAKWLVEQDKDRVVLSDNFMFNVHSANPVGAENIRKYLKQWLIVKEFNNISQQIEES